MIGNGLPGEPPLATLGPIPSSSLTNIDAGEIIDESWQDLMQRQIKRLKEASEEQRLLEAAEGQQHAKSSSGAGSKVRNLRVSDRTFSLGGALINIPALIIYLVLQDRLILGEGTEDGPAEGGQASRQVSEPEMKVSAPIKTHFNVAALVESSQKISFTDRPAEGQPKDALANLANDVISGIRSETGWVQVSLIGSKTESRPPGKGDGSVAEVAEPFRGEAEVGQTAPGHERGPLGIVASEVSKRIKDQYKRSTEPDAATQASRAAQFDRAWTAVMERLMVEGQLGMQRPQSNS